MSFAPGRSTRLAASEASVGAWLAPEAPLVLVTNFGPDAAYLRFGTGEVAADAEHDVPILPMSQLLLTKGVGADAVAAVCSRGETANLYITVGTGT
jgi:hypothetical protein